MTDNMDLWGRVSKTDPKYTKEVGQRGGFTAINAMSQVQEMTREFGPIGVGWGFEYELMFPPNDTVIANVTLWHGKREQVIHQAGQKKLNSGNGADEDAIKKSITDGVTKCISLLGFNADIFLGLWDDNKYVENRSKEIAKAEEKANWTGPRNKTKLREDAWAVWKDVEACTDQDMLAGVIAKGEDVINQLKVDMPEVYEGDGGDKKGLAQVIDEQSAKINERKAT